MSKTTLLLNIDADTAHDAETLFASFGIDTETAVNLFLHQAVLDKGLPFQVKLPADITAGCAIRTERTPVAPEQAPSLPSGTYLAHADASYGDSGMSCGKNLFSDVGAFGDDDEEIGCQG